MNWVRHFLWAVLAFLCLWGGARRAHAEPASEHELNVMTFNIRYGTANDGPNRWENRRQMVCDLIAEHRPDVLGLQEALKFQIDAVLKAVPGYVLIGVGREDGREKGEYSCILYRPERLDLTRSGTFWLSDTPDVPGSITWGNACTRICTWGRFTDRKTGRTFYVYNTHLDHVSQPSRESSAVLIAERMADAKQTPCILMGDFNAGESNAAVRYIKGSAPVAMQDTFRIIHPDEKEVGTFNGFTGRSSGEKIDYVFVGPGWKTLDAAIIRTSRDARYPSDHFPLTAKLLLDNKAD